MVRRGSFVVRYCLFMIHGGRDGGCCGGRGGSRAGGHGGSSLDDHCVIVRGSLLFVRGSSLFVVHCCGFCYSLFVHWEI